MINLIEIVRDEETELFYVSSTNGSCEVDLKLPDKVGSKKLYVFMRVDLDSGKPEDVKEDELPNFVHMEVGNKPLELLYNLTNEIFIPILHNPKNQEGWTELI